MPKGSHNSHSLLKEKLMTNIQRYRANDLAELFDKITKNSIGLDHILISSGKQQHKLIHHTISCNITITNQVWRLH